MIEIKPQGQAHEPRTYFGFDSRTFEENSMERRRPWFSGIPSGASVCFNVPLGHHFGCIPKKLVVTAFIADGHSGLSSPITRVPVKLLSATVRHKPQLPLCHSGGILLGLQPTIEDVLDYEGTPYRMEAPPAPKLTQEQAHLFRTMTPLNISDWEPFNITSQLILHFENIVSWTSIHVFGYVEGEFLDNPHDG